MKPVICGDHIAEELYSDRFLYKNLFEETPDKFISAPYILIVSVDYHQAAALLHQIRSSNIPFLYLKSVFLIDCGIAEIDYIKKGLDKTFKKNEFDENSLDFFSHYSEEINKKIKQIPGSEKPSDNNIAIKVLRYMYTRNSSLEPYKSSIHYLGYTYPVTDFFFEKLNNNLVKLISFLEDHQLISGEFVDRIFSCTQCNSAFLNFREICTECKSPNIEEQQVIHHFRCAYVGPEKDFIREDKLVCPKCKRTLKLVGNDYEKPSDIYSCNNCGNKFQEPDIITECYNCSKKNLPQHLLHPTVKSYKLEELASSVVLYGMNNLFQHDIEKNFPHIKYGSFLKTLETEIERIRRFKLFKSTLCLIKFKNLDKIYLSQGIKANLFIQELSDIIHNVLRRSDLITLYNETIFIILMTHTEIKNAQQAFTRVKENIDKLSEKNLSDKLNFIKINTVEITGVKTSKEIMDELLQNAFH